MKSLVTLGLAATLASSPAHTKNSIEPLDLLMGVTIFSGILVWTYEANKEDEKMRERVYYGNYSSNPKPKFELKPIASPNDPTRFDGAAVNFKLEF